MSTVTDIWRKPLADIDFVVFDLETTGLNPYEGHAIVEFGALKLRGGQPVAHFLELANPGRPIPHEANAVHGISDDDVRDAPPVKELLPDFLEFIEGSALIAQNARFDVSFLAAAHGTEEPPLDNPVLDLIGLTKHFVPGLSSNALGSVCRALGIDNVAAHRAMGDVAASSEIFLVYYEDFLQNGADAELAGLYKVSVADENLNPGLMNYLNWAIAYGREVELLYGNKPDAISQTRKLKPLRVFRAKNKVVTYLKAMDIEKKAERTFKLVNLSRKSDS